jgi:hypothetical protein
MKLRRSHSALTALLFVCAFASGASAKDEAKGDSKELQQACDLAIGGFVDNKLASDEILCVWYGQGQGKKGCLMGLYDAKNDHHSDLFENGSFFGGLNEPCSKVAVLQALHLPKTSYAVGATPNSQGEVGLLRFPLHS